MAGETAMFLCKSSGKHETFSTRSSAPVQCDFSLADKFTRSCWVLLTSRSHRTERYADRRCARMTGKLQGTQYIPEALRVFIVCRPHEQAPRSQAACP
jgi:hypothetical protein